MRQFGTVRDAAAVLKRGVQRVAPFWVVERGLGNPLLRIHVEPGLRSERELLGTGDELRLRLCCGLCCGLACRKHGRLTRIVASAARGSALLCNASRASSARGARATPQVIHGIRRHPALLRRVVADCHQRMTERAHVSVLPARQSNARADRPLAEPRCRHRAGEIPHAPDELPCPFPWRSASPSDWRCVVRDERRRNLARRPEERAIRILRPWLLRISTARRPTFTPAVRRAARLGLAVDFFDIDGIIDGIFLMPLIVVLRRARSTSSS